MSTNNILIIVAIIVAMKLWPKKEAVTTKPRIVLGILSPDDTSSIFDSISPANATV